MIILNLKFLTIFGFILYVRESLSISRDFTLLIQETHNFEFSLNYFMLIFMLFSIVFYTLGSMYF